MPLDGLSPAFALPALRSLGELAGTQPLIVIDTREQEPLVFGRLQSVRGTLTTGDYSIRGLEELFAIERKSIPDLVASVSSDRDRFERELQRMKAYPFRRLVIIGTRAEIESGNYRSRMSPKAVLHTLSAFEVRYGLPICYFPDAPAAALQVESWIFWVARDIVKNANALLASARRGSDG